jgi:hypothetical protein
MLRLRNNKSVFIFCFSTPELKAQVSYSDRQLSVARLSVCPSVSKLDIFDFFSIKTAPILAKLGTSQPWKGGDSKLLKSRELLFSKGDNHKRVKIH